MRCKWHGYFRFGLLSKWAMLASFAYGRICLAMLLSGVTTEHVGLSKTKHAKSSHGPSVFLNSIRAGITSRIAWKNEIFWRRYAPAMAHDFVILWRRDRRSNVRVPEGVVSG